MFIFTVYQTNISLQLFGEKTFWNGRKLQVNTQYQVFVEKTKKVNSVILIMDL